MQITKEQMDQLIEVISHLGFNSGKKEMGTGERLVLAVEKLEGIYDALRGIESNTMNISNALNDLDVTFMRITRTIETIQYNQSNK
jgi:hypothetical protein